MYSREVINTTRNLVIQHLVFGNSLLCKFIGPVSSNSSISTTKPKQTQIRNSSTSTPPPPSQQSNNNNNNGNNNNGNSNIKPTPIDSSFIKKSALFQNSQSLKGKAPSFDWEIYGLESQVIQMNLNPGSSITAETGALLEMESEIEMDTSARGGFLSSFKRMFTGQGLFLTKFVNKSSTDQMRITFSSPYISKILPIKLSDVNGELICQKNAFLCGEDSIEIEPKFTKNFSTGFFGGQGFILQKLSGNGMVFVHAGGSVIYRVLNPGEKIRVTTGSIVAFESTVDFQIEFVKGVKNILFSGEGLTFASITGPGIVVLQSMPFERLVRAIASSGLIGVSTSSSTSSSSTDEPQSSSPSSSSSSSSR